MNNGSSTTMINTSLGGGSSVTSNPRNVQQRKRIEYIDAMRGFTMVLVVLTHVSSFGLGMYGSDTFSYSKIFAEFRMPLFFFVSGFVLYKSNFIWNIKNTIAFIRKKIPVQILSPLLFLLISTLTRNVPFVDALFDSSKDGYWFTFTLFDYYIMYIIAQWFVRIMKVPSFWEDIILASVGLFIFCASAYSIYDHLNIDKQVIGLFGLPTMQYFIFFVFGNRVRKHYDLFEKILDGKFFLFICINIFVWFNIFDTMSLLSSALNKLLLSVSGICVVFAFFRSNEPLFLKTTLLGRVMQYVGTHTLDIYLLHYFFVYSNMQNVLPNYGALNSPFLEFMTSFALSTLVIMSCLAFSRILRSSRILAHYLFGSK